MRLLVRTMVGFRPAMALPRSAFWPGLTRGGRNRSATVDPVTIEFADRRLHPVGVGGGRGGRLRFAHRPDLSGSPPTHRLSAARTALATWVNMSKELPSPGCSGYPKRAGSPATNPFPATLDAPGSVTSNRPHPDFLGRHAHPRVAPPQDLRPQAGVLGIGIPTIAHGEPFDDHRAAGSRPVDRAPNHHPSPERGRTIGYDGRPTVPG
jgi:hypothetical protein